MTDRRSTRHGDDAQDDERDADLGRRLRAAFGAVAMPGAPDSLVAGPARLTDSPRISTRIPTGGRSTLVWAAVVFALLAIATGSLIPAGSGPGPTISAGPSASAEASGPSLTPSPSTSCDPSPATVHGTWWREIGGPDAFFNWDPGPRPAGNTWLLIVRFDPDAFASEDRSVWAEHLGSGERAPAAFNSPMEPSAIYRFDTPAPDLPGGWYLFEQPLPTPGCWRLSAAIEGRVIATAVVEVHPALPPSASPIEAPTPATVPDPS